MSDPLGLSVGTTHLVAALVGSQTVVRRSVLTLSSDHTPQVGLPGTARGAVLTGFVERVGDPVPLVAADGSSYPAERLLSEALDAMTDAVDPADGGAVSGDLAIAVPAYWNSSTQWALRNALRTNPRLAPARLVSDAVATLSALSGRFGLPSGGVLALLDFGGGGTSLTLVNAGAGFEPVAETVRHADFSGDQIDQALLAYVHRDTADPEATASVESLTRLREECRLAKERLSAATVTDLAGRQITRDELETLLSAPLDGVLAVLDDALERHGFGWADVSAVVAAGGGAGIPLIARRLSEHSPAPVLVTPQPGLDAALGAAMFAARSAGADAQTGLSPAVVNAPTEAVPSSGASDARALAWSEDDDAADEPVPYAGEEYDAPTDSVTGGVRPPVQYVPATGQFEVPQTRRRLPLFALAAAVILLGAGGVGYVLTSSSSPEPAPPSSPAPPSPPSVAPAPVTSSPEPAAPPAAPSPEPAPPVTETVQVPVTSTHIVTVTPRTTTQATTAPTPTTTEATTTTTEATTTTTEATTTTTVPTTTVPTNPMTTTYITVPFVPVPIPIQVPQNPFQPPSP